MRHTFNSVILSIGLCGLCGTTFAQNAERAAGHFRQYTDAVRRGNVTMEAYDALLRAHSEYLGVLRSNPIGTDAYENSQEKLEEAFHPIQHAINFYVTNQMHDKAMMAARAYVDLIMCCPKLSTGDIHINIVRAAAINTANAVVKSDPTPEGYSKAIPYLSAYIQTDDVSAENRMEQAYELLGAFAYNIKDYPQAYKVLKAGLKAYPDDVLMLQSMLNTLQRIGKREEELQEYLTRTIALSPGDMRLLELQANVYAKSGNDAGAVETLKKLHDMAPYHHGYMKSLAYHYCNLGFETMGEASSATGKKQKADLKAKARDYFTSASGLLEQLLEGEFSESERLRYNQALVYVYGYIDEKKKQDEAIEELKDHGVTQTGAEIAFADLASEGPAAGNRGHSKPMFTPDDHFEVADVRNSDVDVNLPQADEENPQTFVVIIANENYEFADKVEYAHNDGEKFKEYCHTTLGIPGDNIIMMKDATGGRLRGAIRRLQQATSAFQDASVIFYYAGHGMPDEKTLDSYLIPVDGSPSDSYSNFSVNELYKSLGALPVQHVYVFMDACFSGAKRGDGMLVAARGVVRTAKKESPQGKMVIFSAAQGDETAHPYREKQHGLFTYFLLKKLQETGGDVTLGELGEYIITSVKQTSYKTKLQTPSVSCSKELDGKWEQLPLIEAGGVD